MRPSTNSLGAKAKRFALPLGAIAAIAFTTLFLLFGRTSAQTAGSGQPPLDQSKIAPLISLNQAVQAVAAHVLPAVVNVSVTAKVNQPQGGGGFGGINPQEIPPEFRRFFGFGQGQGQDQGQNQPQYEYGIGSGFIISGDGYIVTNHHVVENAKTIHVTLHDRRSFPAKVVGVDKLDDLAVIKIDANNLPTIPWGDSGKLQPGETVMAFGSPFGSLTFSVTRGIVSAVHRGVSPSHNARAPRDYIQTDAAINPGNSGGPLVDAYGRVVGIDTFIYTSSGSFAGAGFAIPSLIAQHSISEIIKTGKVVHGFLGIGITDVTPENANFFKVPNASGALIDQVNPDTPASRAGLKQGDVIRKLNGKEITDATEIQVAVSEMSPGTAVTLDILRDGNPMTIHATIGEYQATSQQAENNGAGQQHAQLGISVENLSPDIRQQLGVPTDVNGVAIQSVQAGSAADEAGLSPGNIIMQVNRQPVTTAAAFADQVRALPAGQSVLLLVWSKQGTIYLVVHPNAAGGTGNPQNNDNNDNQ